MICMIPSSLFSFLLPSFFFSFPFPSSLLCVCFCFFLPFYFFPSFSSYHSLREAFLAVCNGGGCFPWLQSGSEEQAGSLEGDGESRMAI